MDAWLRTTVGVRADGSRYDVTDTLDPRNSGRRDAGLVSPKGTVTLGPWRGTELYVNAGTGFHSNNALGTTISLRCERQPADRASRRWCAPRAAEVGVRTVAIPHLQSTVSLWMLRLDSELVYNGDVGATEPGPASRRYGVEFANYYSPKPWLIFDGDVSWSQARFAEFNEARQLRARGRGRSSSRAGRASTTSIARSPACGCATSGRGRSSRTTRCGRRPRRC